MFPSKNAAPHTGFMRRHAHVSLLALAILGAAGVFAPPLAAPVSAAGTASVEKKQDYEKLAASVKALSDAFKRELRKAGVENTETLDDFESHSKKAARLAAAGKYDEAHSLLNESYHTLAAAIITLENARNKGISTGRSSTAVTVDPNASSAEQREFIAHEIDTNKALIDALKHQNDDRGGGKESEIASIKTTAAKAESALNAGDIARAGTLIHDANSRVKTAIASLQTHPEKTLQRKEEGVDEGVRSSYAKRKESVVALLEAGERIEDAEGEKGASHSEFSIAKDLFKEAEALAAAGRFADGKIQLDIAYLLAKDAVRSLRGGAKLRDDKNFATKADEYKYEQARNDDYQELVAKLIKGKKDRNLVQAFDKARNLRHNAEDASKSGNFELALNKIEESTNALKILLRRAGLPIIWSKP